MRRKITLGQALGVVVILIALPTTINDGIAGWAGWLGWINERQWQFGLSALGVVMALATTAAQVILHKRTVAALALIHEASPSRRRPEAREESAAQPEPAPEAVPGELSVADLPPPAKQAWAEMTRRRRIADLVVARAVAARDLRSAFDDFIETFLSRRAQYEAGMTENELERAREEYARLQRRAVRAYRAIREHYRRFLEDEPQYDRSSPDPDFYVAKEWLADWWSPLTFDAALANYANADNDHLRRYMAEERAILDAFAEWIAEPRHHDLAEDGVDLENEEILGLIQRALAQREPARQRATLSARPGATSGREFADEYTFDIMNSGPATALQVKVWAARADGTRAAAPVDLWTLPPDNRWNPVRVEIPRQFSDAGGLRLIVSWQDDSGEHEEALLEIRPLR